MLGRMTEVQQLVQRYIETWNETDPGRRRALVSEVFTEDAAYTDPLVAVSGHAAIDQFVGAAQAQFAGLRFTLGSPVDAHHDQARFAWHLGEPGAESPIVIGFDVAVMREGRMREVFGFLDKAPSAGAAA
jgi:hypothetical protein